MQALRAAVLVEVQRDLAVGAGPQAMAPVLEFASDGLVAVELPVGDDPGPLVLARDRLSAGFQIDDAEPGVGEGHATVRAKPNTVHFMILIAAVKSIRTVGCELRGRSW